jgi:hypothetical protein
MEMSLKTEEKEIDGSLYTVTSYSGRESLKIKKTLMRLFAPVIPVLVKVLGQISKDTSVTDMDVNDLDFTSIGKAITELLDQLTEDEYVDLVLRLLRSTRRDNREITGEYFDLHFAGNLTTLYKVLFFVIQVNYPDFFQLGASIGNSQSE